MEAALRKARRAESVARFMEKSVPAHRAERVHYTDVRVRIYFTDHVRAVNERRIITVGVARPSLRLALSVSELVLRAPRAIGWSHAAALLARRSRDPQARAGRRRQPA